MIIKILSFVLLLVLFFLLSKAADLIIVNIRKVGEKLGIKIFILGIILGILTNLPEMAIGINSTINDVAEISFGNIVGGNLVLLGLMLPISIILNRKIKTHKKPFTFLLTVGLLFLPLLLGLKGGLSMLDGLILMLSYLFLVYYLYRSNREKGEIKISFVKRKDLSKHILLIILGMVGVIIVSELIIKTTIFALKDYNISAFVIGLLLYSIGTNLPELTIAIRSFKKKAEELSLSHLIGSSISNILILGALSFTKAIKIEVDTSYMFLTLFSLIFFTTLYLFYKSDRLLSRKEGVVLLVMYLFFVATQIIIQVK